MRRVVELRSANAKEGAARGAESLGDRLETLFLRQPRKRATGLALLLLHRENEGVLVPTTFEPDQRLAELIDWSRVAAVATT